MLSRIKSPWNPDGLQSLSNIGLAISRRVFIAGTSIPFIGPLFSIALCVFIIIWFWKIFEKIGKPGWWAILLLIPIVNLVMLGITAWSKK